MNRIIITSTIIVIISQNQTIILPMCCPVTTTTNITRNILILGQSDPLPLSRNLSTSRLRISFFISRLIIIIAIS